MKANSVNYFVLLPPAQVADALSLLHPADIHFDILFFSDITSLPTNEHTCMNRCDINMRVRYVWAESESYNAEEIFITHSP